ncbi:MAG: radical SAM protein [Clostridia bacterium]|nr:radical SAM protein [Clostridia bacterium]
MKNVYFVQVDVSATYNHQNAYLPYTAGVLAAAAWESEIVKREYSFKGFIFLRENVNEVAERLENPAVVAFSCYSWNTEYNKALAGEIKKRFPACVIVFGGHNVPDDFTMLAENPFIDFLCHGEGEDTTRILFEALATHGDFSKVPNISYRTGDSSFNRTETVCQKTLDYPSPYLNGWFDKIIDEHPDIVFNAILETSRGCPNQCAYCDWGLLKSRVRLFPLERIVAEVQWMSDHKVAFVWGADANFGMFDRDLEIADALVEVKKKTGYPERMRMNYAKNNFENVFAIVKKFKECDFDRIGATLSFQSMSPEVLKNIGRTNRDLDFYKNLLAKYNKEHMKTYSELILGLPGETYDSFISGLCTLFEIGQHYVFEIYGCILLPNSMMGQKDYIKKFGIKTVRSELIRPHFQNEAFAVPEYNQIVVETNTMSREMYVRATAFAYLVKSFHGSGLLRAFAVYLYLVMKVPYKTFYDGIIDYFENNPGLFASKLYFDIKEHADRLSLGSGNTKLVFKHCGDVIWEDHEYYCLNALNRIDEFYEDLTPYIKTFHIDNDVFNDLLLYQKNILRKPDEAKAEIDLNYDIHTFLSDAYINDFHSLDKKKHRLVMKDSNPMPDWETFGKQVVWYGRMGWASYKDNIEIKPETGN